METFAGEPFGNRDFAVLTPSAVALVVLLCLAATFAVGVGLTYLEKHLGVFAKINSNVIEEGDQYRRVVRRMSRVGLELRRKSQHRQLTLFSLDAESRMAPCALCNRPCHEANFGSASSAFRGAVSGSADDYMCVDCFAYIDTQEHESTRKILEDWRQSGGHRASPRRRKMAPLMMEAAAAANEAPAHEEQPLPVRAATKREMESEDEEEESKADDRSASHRSEPEDDDDAALATNKKKKKKKVVKRARTKRGKKKKSGGSAMAEGASMADEENQEL